MNPQNQKTDFATAFVLVVFLIVIAALIGYCLSLRDSMKALESKIVEKGYAEYVVGTNRTIILKWKE